MRDRVPSALPVPGTVLAILALLSACRDAPAPYDPGEPPDPGAVRRLTFDGRHDRAPSWTPDGTRIVYVRGTTLSGGAATPTLLSIPAEGGAADLVFPDLQSEDGTGSRPLAAPAIDPRTGRVAFQLRVRLAPPGGCGTPVWLCESGGHTQPVPAEGTESDPAPPYTQLDLLALKVRAPGDVVSLEGNPGIEVPIAGRTEDPHAVNPPLFEPVTGQVIVDWFPAHDLFATDGTLFFRPSWSPMTDEVVFSDGLGLWTWRVGEPAATRIPGTQDGISPAWSPDGQRIAFVRLSRGAPLTDTCGQFSLNNTGTQYLPRCVQRTTTYGPVTATVELVRPDGSGGQVIGEGRDPAWSLDGGSLYVRRGDQIRRIGIDTDEDLPVPGTEGGREPAVSPDGAEIAFSRSDESGYDIWVVPASP